MKYYKFLTDEHRGEYSGFDFTAYLPKNGKPGKWLPTVDKLEKCKSGYHACTKNQLLKWLNAEMYEIEYKVTPRSDWDKVWGTQIRFVKKIDAWNDKEARLFAVWCAREALKLVKKPDPRSINACNVAERYANGQATKEELDAARAEAWETVGAAAWAEAWEAAREAARAAAWEAETAQLLNRLNLETSVYENGARQT